MRTGFDALIAADAVRGILGDGVLVDAKDIHLAQNALRAGFHTLPASLTDMCVDDYMFRQVLGRTLGSVSFHRRKGKPSPCIKTITFVNKLLAGSDSAQGNRCDAEI